MAGRSRSMLSTAMTGVDISDDTRLGGSDIRRACTSGVFKPCSSYRSGVSARSRRGAGVDAVESPEEVRWCVVASVDPGRRGDDGSGVRAAERRGICLKVDVRRDPRGKDCVDDAADDGPDGASPLLVLAVDTWVSIDGRGLTISFAHDTASCGGDAGSGGSGGDPGADES